MGTNPTRNPDPNVHSQFRVRGGNLSRLAGRKVIVFLHGYNVSTREGLQHNEAFFGRLQASLTRDGRNLDDYGFLGFTWPGDVGPVHFNDAQRFAHLSGTALYLLITELAREHQVRSITLVTHSLGAHVGLRGAAILGERLFHRARELFSIVVF